MPAEVAVLGRIGYDLYSEEPGLPLPKVRRFARYLGGSSANIAVGLARLGVSTAIISAVGDDLLADFLLGFLSSEGVDTRRVRRVPGVQSSLCLTEICPPSNFRQVFYRNQAADTRLDIGDDDLAGIRAARMFVTNGTSLCASPARESTYRALEAARQAGCTVVVDADYRSMSWESPEQAGAALRPTLRHTDVFIGNDEEFRLVSGCADVEDAGRFLVRQGVRVVVSKLGDRGTRLIADGRESFLPPYRVAVVSTIGAGDGFAAGFLFGRLEGRSWDDCLRLGNAAAAIVVSRLSCSEAMPSRPELEQFLANQ